jgi:predicted nucleic acid-binding protein
VTGPMLYLDTSAFLKLLVTEKGSKALRATVADADLWSSTLLDVEAHRAARMLGVAPEAVADALEAVALLAPSETTFASAREVGPDTVRTLDALHLAAAIELGEELDAVVTYDARLADGCEAVGLSVLAPGAGR